MVSITEVAAKKVGEFIESQGKDAASAGLRVGVKGGGCSGFTYSLGLDQPRDGDQTFESNGIRVFVDEESLRYVDQSEVDYVETLQASGFQVNNPNVVAACGCGSSFRVKDEEEVNCPSGAAAV